MAKDKKGKKGQEEFGEEVEAHPGKAPPSGDSSSSVKQTGKKGKKNRKKDDWEDDIAKELEALSLENQGANKSEPQEEEEIPERKPKEKKKTKGDAQIEDFDEDNFKGKQFKKQKGKKGKVEDSDDETTKNNQNDKTSITNNKKISAKDSKNKGKRDDVDNDEETSVYKKNVKGKKKGKGVDSDDDSIELSKTERRKQKGKDVSDEEDSKKDSTIGKGKGKKNRKRVKDDDDDDDSGENRVERKVEKTKLNKGKTSAKHKGKRGAATDSEDEDLPKSTIKTIATKTGFALLNMEEIDDAIDIDEESPIEEDKESLIKVEIPIAKTKSKMDCEPLVIDDSVIAKKEEKTGKKVKKKERKKRDDDVDKILEELALEMDDKKASEKSKDIYSEKKEESTVANDTKLDDTDKQIKKKKKKKGDSEMFSEKVEITKELSPEVPGDELTVKSTAQKKKEKKEKQKRAAQSEQECAKKSKDDKIVLDKKVVLSEEPAVVPSSETLDLDEEDETEDKKKKKKKKRGEEDEKKDKKRPGKKQIAAMQEALKKVQEEEERLKKEEEERIRAEEEAERIRQEKLRLEQEKKEKKKQKEKEKRERLKAEGKLLTKSQRQARARMEATLAALRQQGVEVPQIGEKKERAPRLGDRKRPSRKRAEDQQDAATESQDVEISIIDHEGDIEGLKQEKIDIDEQTEDVAIPSDDVKDAWDETSEEEMEDDDDDQEESSVSPKKVEVIKSPPKKTVKTQESIEESEEESETEDSSSDESESEESSEESEEELVKHEIKARERAEERIKRRREEAEKNRTTNKLRSPVVCVLGHVDTGKTKILDKIRRTHVQDSEAGGITQQIGATMVPQEALKEQCKMVKGFADLELKVPGLLIIDTPGHESFSNLRSRGSSLCDIAVLVVDIMHGLEPQTIESLNLLKKKKTPFIVALNKVDRLYEWKSIKNKDIQDVIKSQARNTKMEFEKKLNEVFLQFANESMNASLFYENKDPRTYISIVPTSALSGDGMGNLMALLVELTQSMMAKRLAFSEELQATVLEVKAISGLGTTIDVILVNGKLREGDTIVLAGHEGAMVTQIRSLLMPQPLKELRVKNMYQEFKEVEGSQGVKVAGKDLEKAIAGLQLLVAHHPDEVEIFKEEVNTSFQDAMNSIRLAERGVYVQASTLGSLEALLEFLKVSKIPYSGIRIGPVVKKDVMKASIMLEHDSQYAVILAFDVKIERDAQDLADSLGVKIFQADIIYHLFDKFMAYRDELRMKRREEFKHQAVFPCKLRILPQYIFNSRDPIIVGVIVEAGVVRDGTPLCVPSKDFLDIGVVTTIEVNHKSMESARRGQEVCIKIEPSGGEAPKMFGRHFDHTDMLVSKISRQSIDVCKEYFRDDLQKTDWQLMVELKKTFQIL